MRELQRGIADIIKEVAEDPDQYSMWAVATDLIAKVRDYLIDEAAEVPENPYQKTYHFIYVRITRAEIAERLYEAYEKAQQDMLAAGYRKVREEK